MDIINKAEKFAREKHKGQKDDTGEDYFEAHLRVVLGILMNVTNNKAILSAGLLHDTLEDTKTTYEELKQEFGQKIADLVHEVTHEGQSDKHGFYFPRLKTKEGIMIKMADRLSNISRMENWDEKKKEQYLRKSKFWRSE